MRRSCVTSPSFTAGILACGTGDERRKCGEDQRGNPVFWLSTRKEEEAKEAVAAARQQHCSHQNEDEAGYNEEAEV